MSERLAQSSMDLPPMSADTPLYNEIAAPYMAQPEHLLTATTETKDQTPADEQEEQGLPEMSDTERQHLESVAVANTVEELPETLSAEDRRRATQGFHTTPREAAAAFSALRENAREQLNTHDTNRRAVEERLMSRERGEAARNAHDSLIADAERLDALVDAEMTSKHANLTGGAREMLRTNLRERLAQDAAEAAANAREADINARGGVARLNEINAENAEADRQRADQERQDAEAAKVREFQQRVGVGQTVATSDGARGNGETPGYAKLERPSYISPKDWFSMGVNERRVAMAQPLRGMSDQEILAVKQEDIADFEPVAMQDYYRRLQAIKAREHMNRDRSQDGVGRPPVVDGVIVKAKGNGGNDPAKGDSGIGSPFMDLFDQQPVNPAPEPAAQSDETPLGSFEDDENDGDQAGVPDFLSPDLGEGERFGSVPDRGADDTFDFSNQSPVRTDSAGHDNGSPYAAEQFPRDADMDEAARSSLEAARARGQGGEADIPTGFGASWRGIRGRAGQRPRLFREGLLSRIRFNRKPSADGPEGVAEMIARDEEEATEKWRRYEQLRRLAGGTATGQEVISPVPPNQQRGFDPQARPVESVRPVALAPSAGGPLDELFGRQQ
ncbi:MAG TPA: hypothetical protein VF809_02825 [Candidatus Saccharimonadales bacterium]